MAYMNSNVHSLAKGSDTEQPTRHFHDFDHKNVGLIVGVFAVLVVLTAAQGNLFGSATTLGLTLGRFNSVFATPASNSTKGSSQTASGQVLGASTLSPDLESQMKALPIVYAYKDTVGAAETYAQQVHVVESADNGNDAKLATDLLAIAVPQTLGEYQQLIVLRAQLGAQLQAASVGQQAQIQANLDAVNQQVQQVQSSFTAQGVNLPS